MRPLLALGQLARNQRGAVMIETAIVAPVLIMMSLGAFQVSQIVARQTAEADGLTQEVATGLKRDVFAANGPAATRSLEVRAHRSANTAYLDTNRVLQGRLESMAAAAKDSLEGCMSQSARNC